MNTEKNFKIENNNITFNGYDVVKVNTSADFQPTSTEIYLEFVDEEGYKVEEGAWLPEAEEIVIVKNGKEYLVKETKNGAEISTKGYERIEDYLESDEYNEECIPVGYTKSGRMERINSFKAF